ncbi:hypothetical protein Droror1_Dr00020043 [Drosera rotundifolia]
MASLNRCNSLVPNSVSMEAWSGYAIRADTSDLFETELENILEVNKACCAAMRESEGLHQFAKGLQALKECGLGEGQFEADEWEDEVTAGVAGRADESTSKSETGFAELEVQAQYSIQDLPRRECSFPLLSASYEKCFALLSSAVGI